MLSFVTPSFAQLILRVVVGAIFLAHGIPKFKNPKPGWKVLGLVESLSAIALILNVAVPLAGAAIVVVMLGAMYHKIFKWKAPFSNTTAGWEFDLLILASALVLIALYGLAY